MTVLLITLLVWSPHTGMFLVLYPYQTPFWHFRIVFLLPCNFFLYVCMCCSAAAGLWRPLCFLISKYYIEEPPNRWKREPEQRRQVNATITLLREDNRERSCGCGRDGGSWSLLMNVCLPNCSSNKVLVLKTLAFWDLQECYNLL